jgi:hypothetical protein
MIDLSLNEVESLAAKAARGAGLAWGLADDVGRAARRLAAAGLPWADAVLRLPHDDRAARIGARLADEPPDDGATVEAVTDPLLLIAMAAQDPSPRRFEWAGRCVMSVGGHLDVLAMPGDAPCPATLIVRSSAASDVGARLTRCHLDEAAHTALERLGAATYVPASDRSRTAGAGAGLTDND